MKWTPIILFFLLSCGTPGRKPPVVSIPSERPERAASQALVEKGRPYLDRGSFDRAEDTFQEAVNVDPTNGVGFYYLALVKYRMGEYESVGNYLDKAEALLMKDRDWSKKIKALREEVGENAAVPPS